MRISSDHGGHRPPVEQPEHEKSQIRELTIVNLPVRKVTISGTIYDCG